MEETVATLMAHLMADQGLSARGLSLKAGLRPTAVRDILNGRSKRPRADTIAKIAYALGIRAQDLAREDGKLNLIGGYANSKENFSRLLAATQAYGKDANIAGAVVFGDAKAANMSKANLAGASFVGANLRGADLSRANLSFTNFTGCDLREVNFQDAIFHNTVFVGADLRGANLAGVDLSEAIFVGSK